MTYLWKFTFKFICPTDYFLARQSNCPCIYQYSKCTRTNRAMRKVCSVTAVVCKFYILLGFRTWEVGIRYKDIWKKLRQEAEKRNGWVIIRGYWVKVIDCDKGSVLWSQKKYVDVTAFVSVDFCVLRTEAKPKWIHSETTRFFCWIILTNGCLSNCW